MSYYCTVTARKKHRIMFFLLIVYMYFNSAERNHHTSRQSNDRQVSRKPTSNSRRNSTSQKATIRSRRAGYILAIMVAHAHQRRPVRRHPHRHGGPRWKWKNVPVTAGLTKSLPQTQSIVPVLLTEGLRTRVIGGRIVQYRVRVREFCSTCAPVYHIIGVRKLIRAAYKGGVYSQTVVSS